jgi:hypothetical protein
MWFVGKFGLRLVFVLNSVSCFIPRRLKRGLHAGPLTVLGSQVGEFESHPRGGPHREAQPLPLACQSAPLAASLPTLLLVAREAQPLPLACMSERPSGGESADPTS